KYLHQETQAHDDLELLSWAKLAFDAHRGLPEADAALAGLDERIKQAYETRSAIAWLRPTPVRVALTALALGTERKNLFRLEEPAVISIAEAPVVQKRRPLTERFKSVFRGMALQAAGQLRPLPLKS